MSDVRDLARELTVDPHIPPLNLRQGVVTAVSTTPPSCTVKVGGSSVGVSGVRYLASVGVAVGDTVWLLQNGTDLFILGQINRGLHGGADMSPGIELYHPSSTPFIDFHRAANPAGDSSADFNVRLINDAANKLRLVTASASDSITGGTLDVGNAWIGSHPVHGAVWANFGHKSQIATNNYGFMQSNAGMSLMNSASGQSCELLTDGVWKFKINTAGALDTAVRLNVTGGIVVWTDWVRVKGSEGIYFEDRGGGIHMSDSTWVRVYNNKAFWCFDELKTDTRLNVANICFAGGSGAHGGGWAQFSHWAYRNDPNFYGFMHSGGTALISADICELRHYNSGRLITHSGGVSTNGVYFSTRGASVYLKSDGDNAHRIYWNGTFDAIITNSWSYVSMEAVAHDHSTRCEAQTRHVNRANSVWRYSDAAGHTNFSDPKFKKNIKKVPMGKNKVKEIEPIEFQWDEKHDHREPGRKNFGFDASTLPPEVVVKSYLANEETGEPEECLMMDPVGVLAVAWEAIREIAEATESFETRLAALEKNKT